MYETAKALHIIAVICWMAGLLYLPRLMVYHCKAIPGGELDQTLKIMERRLHRFIMTPAMIATWGAGLWLAIGFIGFSAGWLHIKLVLVIFLTICHFLLGNYVKSFEKGQNSKSERFFRLINEVPTLLMIAIVILVITKPF